MQKIETAELLKGLSQEQISQILTQLLQQKQPEIDRITIKDLCKKHITYAKAREFSKNYIEFTIILSHKNFLNYTAQRGIIYADEITYDHTEEFYEFLKKLPNLKKKNGELSTKYILMQYKTIKAMFAIAERRGHITKNRFENKVFPLKQVNEWWTNEYVYNQLIPAIRKYAKSYNKVVTELKVKLTLTQGLRAGMIHRIKRKDVTIIPETNQVFISMDCKVPKSSEMQKHTPEIVENTTKRMFLEHIKKLDSEGIKPNDYIFTKTSPKGGYNYYRHTLIKVCKKAGIPYLTPHKAKHGCITMLAEAGYTAEQICKFTGNLTPSLIQKVYMHLSAGKVSEQIKRTLNDQQ